MKLANLVGERFKERPADCNIDSHALMIRGGYIKYVANGIYSSFMPMKRTLRKIENIIRQEMDAIDGQEVLFPVVMPAILTRLFWSERMNAPLPVTVHVAERGRMAAYSSGYRNCFSAEQKCDDVSEITMFAALLSRKIDATDKDKIIVEHAP